MNDEAYFVKNITIDGLDFAVYHTPDDCSERRTHEHVNHKNHTR